MLGCRGGGRLQKYTSISPALDNAATTPVEMKPRIGRPPKNPSQASPASTSHPSLAPLPVIGRHSSCASQQVGTVRWSTAGFRLTRICPRRLHFTRVEV